MKEHPILFSGPMVDAILKGQKTQTRRVINLGPVKRVLKGSTSAIWTVFKDRYLERWWWGDQHGATEVKCPYGKAGDRLWVREKARLRSVGPKIDELDLAYAADEIVGDPVFQSSPRPYVFTRWTPSIHMPRWASRITLEITGVRVERVQEISKVDCLAEGMWPGDPRTSEVSHKIRYQNLWNSINADRGFGWDKNPWVWVVEFKRIGPK